MTTTNYTPTEGDRVRTTSGVEWIVTRAYNDTWWLIPAPDANGSTGRRRSRELRSSDLSKIVVVASAADRAVRQADGPSDRATAVAFAKARTTDRTLISAFVEDYVSFGRFRPLDSFAARYYPDMIANDAQPTHEETLVLAHEEARAQAAEVIETTILESVQQAGRQGGIDYRNGSDRIVEGLTRPERRAYLAMYETAKLQEEARGAHLRQVDLAIERAEKSLDYPWVVAETGVIIQAADLRLLIEAAR